ncbi:MAG: ABC transporter ATP-binding protein [Desulfobacteraceae bacterium]|nr:ABC transporter ATP-binding protein [Desulfobacteraceae bacterium]
MSDPRTSRERLPDTGDRNPPPPTLPALEVRNISKKFGTVDANRDISLSVRPGEIHAVVGENGAGKSTLMNMIFGRISPDSGAILLSGNPVCFRSPRDAIRAGIGMVHQNILCFPQLSVLENVICGSEPSRARLVRTTTAREELLRLQGLFGFHLDPDLPVLELPFAQRQQIEILRALYRRAEILILDEPTSLLAPGETDRLLSLLESLRAGGNTILFISHRLSEVFRIADRVTVLRKGRALATIETAATDPCEIARLMVGASRNGAREGKGTGNAADFRQPCNSGEAVLEISGLSIRAREPDPAIRNITISIGRGEIFGIGGIVGNGQRVLAGAIAGRIIPDEGIIRVRGEDVTALRIGARIKRGIHWLPEDLNGEALLPDHAVWENFLLGLQRESPFSRGNLLMPEEIVRYCSERIAENGIEPPDPHLRVARLSGGNRQKVAVGRILARKPVLAVIEQPSRGLDLHASARLRERLVSLCRAQGTAMLVFSYDLEELTALCDRIAVLYRGEVMGTAARGDFSCELLGRWMAGMKEPRGKEVHP